MIYILMSSDFVIYKDNLTLFVDISSNIFIWISLIISCIILSVIAIILLFKNTKKPKKWIHEPFSKNKSFPGVLRDLSDSIRSEKKLYQYSSSIDKTLLMMFFKKIEDKKDISIDKLLEMKKEDPNKLYEVIKDEYIINWMENLENKNQDKSGRFGKIKKQKYLKELSLILDKMEAWNK